MSGKNNALEGISTPGKVKNILQDALEEIGTFERCALLDYPNHLNIGDHLIWLGEVFYLTEILKTQIGYVASVLDFSPAVMEKQIGKAPILLHGGGNLGDLWPDYQRSREQIIAKYRDRSIIILPQSIYFSSQENLKRSASIFNAHPNLTIFARENYSYAIAQEYFHQCRIIKAPDMAFQMIGMPGLSSNPRSKHSILYLCRQDNELNREFSPTAIDLPNLRVDDWVSYRWIYREMIGDSSLWYWRLPGLVRLIREGWQRRLAVPGEWISREFWQGYHPSTKSFESLDREIWHQQSWSLLHSAIAQFKQHRLIITNRLHGHILCLLLGIPHILLPNSYYKNESFYSTWTYQIPFCKFIKEPSQVREAAFALINGLP